ncbi:TPA: hypothetical protein K4M41_004457 [Vibrio parahaemolyticus]|uniref:Uncharacterized protein n=1 Tax=Vibrio sp. 1F_97 TaxID=1652827 RepID=A0A0H3ZM56_9VIBR|nr:hypothetical protein [Vibrio cyclitrophicus]AKN37333.1 hypothetical protein [Vibrio sp. 1F_97]ELB2912187.1 hypothetical protein [Vibrio parahaemolyticus]OEF28066.1 hypothetical protein OA9_00870 [Vibrio cyclitrophicus 1F97]HBI3715640.1 hypothetical protein [Vibrio parahaemolyticus]
MAEPTTNTLANTSAAIVIANGVSESGFAKSLLSASFEQVINGQFYWQLSDILTLVCSAIVIINYVQTRIEKRKQNRPEERQGKSVANSIE